MLVHHVDVGLDVGAARGHPGVAVIGVAGGAVGAQTLHAQRQQQAAVTHHLDRGMDRNGLEAGVQQRRMHAIAGLLHPDRTRQADLGQHRADRAFRDMRCGQTGEGRTELNSALVEPVPQLVAFAAGRMR